MQRAAKRERIACFNTMKGVNRSLLRLLRHSVEVRRATPLHRRRKGADRATGAPIGGSGQWMTRRDGVHKKKKPTTLNAAGIRVSSFTGLEGLFITAFGRSCRSLIYDDQLAGALFPTTCATLYGRPFVTSSRILTLPSARSFSKLAIIRLTFDAIRRQVLNRNHFASIPEIFYDPPEI